MTVAVALAVLFVILSSIGFAYERLTKEAQRQINNSLFIPLHSVVTPVWMGLISYSSWPILIGSAITGFSSIGRWWPIALVILWVVGIATLSPVWPWPGPAEGLAIMTREATRRKNEAFSRQDILLGSKLMMLILELERIGKPKTVDESSV